jgi:hypothetical protein
MRGRNKIHSRVGLMVLLMAVLTLAWVPAQAQIAPNSDNDNDGFSAEWETLGCSYSATANLIMLDARPFFPNCGATTNSQFVDPSIPDVFVILTPLIATAPSLLRTGPNWLEYITHVRSPYRVHQINRTAAIPPAKVKKVIDDPTVPQLAIRVYEDSTSAYKTGYVLGKTTGQGTPNDPGDSFVYTKRIQDYVLSVYTRDKHDTLKKQCVYQDPKTVNPQVICATNETWSACVAKLPGLYDIYKKQVIAHEAGHKTKLSAYCDPKIGCHYQSGTGVLMDQAVVVKETSTAVTWYIPYRHNDSDVPVLK